MSYKNVPVTAGVYKDIRDGAVYQSKRMMENYVTIVWHIDGAPTIHSRNLQIWLITAFIVEINIGNRFSLKNIIICGLWYGPKKPDFDLFQIGFVRQLKYLMNTGFSITLDDQDVWFKVQVEGQLADLPAKAASLNMKQFNGKFGCSICYHPGRKLQPNSMVWIYPFQDEVSKAQDRSPEDVILHAETADATGQQFFGLKGKSVVLDVVQVPFELPLDYMHLALEGELKRITKLLFIARDRICSQDDIDDINTIIKRMKFPHDFHKKVNVINDSNIKKTKAGELQVLLLHVLLPVLRNVMPVDLFCHFGLFVTSMQILNQDYIDDNDIDLAYNMIRHYQKLKPYLFDDDATQTYTLHGLGHLASQRRWHGSPLVLMSNFVFEGFIATIKRQFHGSRGIITQMVKNIGLLQNSRNLAKKIGGPPSVELMTKKLLRDVGPEKTKVDEHTYLYGRSISSQPVIGEVNIPHHITAMFSSQEVSYSERLSKNGNIYHSLAYKKRKSSSSYLISYYHDGRRLFGKVLFFANTSQDCYVILQSMKQTGQNLFDGMEGAIDDVVDDFISNCQLGKCFYYVEESDEVLVISHRCVLSRVVLVPVDEQSGYVSLVLNSYQHD